MKLFLDNNLPPAFARALHALSEKDGHTVTHLSEKFDREIFDPDWIRALRANPSGLTTGETVDVLKAAKVTLSQDTVGRHARALVKAGKALKTGKGPATRYVALAESPQAPSAEYAGAENE